MFSPATAAAILNRHNKIAAKNQAVLSLAPGAPLHDFSLLPHTPVVAQVVKVYCPVEQLRPGKAGVLTPTQHPLHPAACPLVQSIEGKHLLGPILSLPSLTPLTHPPVPYPSKVRYMPATMGAQTPR